MSVPATIEREDTSVYTTMLGSWILDMRDSRFVLVAARRAAVDGNDSVLTAVVSSKSTPGTRSAL